jgi:hypothetical protein
MFIGISCSLQPRNLNRSFSLIPANQFSSAQISGDKSFRLQLREQDQVADAFLAEGHHADAVNADAAGRRLAVFERDEESSVSYFFSTRSHTSSMVSPLLSLPL